jgi:flagella basal body P-ring formation protein FlgA
MKRSNELKTTETRRLRRLPSALLVGILTLAAVALTPCAGAQAVDARWQPPETIAAAARDAAESAASGDAEAVSIDARLKLARCAQPLEAKIERAIDRGRGTVAVSCSRPSPWRLFVPVRMTNDVVVLVLTRAVQPGEVLEEADVETVRRSASSLPHDYFSDGEQAVGLAARRAHPAGAVVTAAALEAPEVVRRGELVTLTAGDGPITVRAEGIALEPAKLRGRLKVRSASGRVVEGTAEGPGQVRVGS